jgi:hypothetical protein
MCKHFPTKRILKYHLGSDFASLVKVNSHVDWESSGALKHSLATPPTSAMPVSLRYSFSVARYCASVCKLCVGLQTVVGFHREHKSLKVRRVQCFQCLYIHTYRMSQRF